MPGRRVQIADNSVGSQSIEINHWKSIDSNQNQSSIATDWYQFIIDNNRIHWNKIIDIHPVFMENLRSCWFRHITVFLNSRLWCFFFNKQYEAVDIYGGKVNTVVLLSCLFWDLFVYSKRNWNHKNTFFFIDFHRLLSSTYDWHRLVSIVIVILLLLDNAKVPKGHSVTVYSPVNNDYICRAKE